MSLKKLGINKELLGEYLPFFKPSLDLYKDKYEPYVFQDTLNLLKYVIYICPLCAKNYMLFLEHDYAFTEEFSLDHFPPKNVGGQLKAIVCKTCNNNAGGLFDYITKDFLAEHAFHKGVPFTEIDMKSKIAGVAGNYSGRISVREDGKPEIKLKPNTYFNAPLLDDWLTKGIKGDDWKIDVTIPIAKKEIVSKAFLKIAYLACFNHWGYEFIFSKTGENIRKVFDGLIEYPFQNIPVFVFDDPEQMKSVPLGVCYIREPLNWQSFIVNFPLILKANNYNCIASVLIPPHDNWQLLDNLNEEFKIIEDKKVNFLALTPAMLLKKYDAYASNWNDLFISE